MQIDKPTPPAAKAPKEAAHSEPHSRCPKCGSDQLRRSPRAGFIQFYVFTLFGYYPWECIRCGERFMRRKRYKSRKHSTREDSGRDAGKI